MTYSATLSSASKISRLLKAVSNDRRLKILCYLAEGERSVNELCDLIEIGQSALSQHLAKLRFYKLVRTRRQSQNIYYSLDSSDVVYLLNALESMLDSEVGSSEKEEPSYRPNRAIG